MGAPLFMDRGSDGKLREVGQVYVYLGKGGFTFNNVIKLTGSEVYARYGSSICSVGDLNMDGYNGTILTCLTYPLNFHAVLFGAQLSFQHRHTDSTYIVICGHGVMLLSLFFFLIVQQ